MRTSNKWLWRFYLINYCLFLLLSLNYCPRLLLSDKLIGSAGVSLIVIAAIFQFLGFIALLTAVICCLPAFITSLLIKNLRVIKTLSVSCTAIGAWWLFLDTMVFKSYYFHIQGLFLTFLLSGYANQVFELSWLEWTLSGAVLLLFILLEIGLAYCASFTLNLKPQIKNMGAVIISQAGCLLLSLFIVLTAVSQPYTTGANTMLYHQIYTNSQLLPFYDQFITLFLPHKYGVDRLEETGAGIYLQPAHQEKLLRYPLHPLQFSPAQKPLNILIIGIDTWRFDMMNAEVTPNIFQFAQNSLVFTHHVSGGNSTTAGLVSLFYSLPSTYWPALKQEQMSPVLMDALLAQHYQLGAFSSATAEVEPYNKTLFVRVPHFKAETPGATPAIRDEVVKNELSEYLDTVNKSQQPFFGFVFFDSAHSYCEDNKIPIKFSPTVNVCERITLTNKSDPTPYFNRYKNALYYVDGLAGQILNQVKATHQLDNTIVIITGDHGEEFNDDHNDMWEHASNFTRYQTHTPLVIYWPGKKPALIAYQTTHYDIVPTLLQMVLGCRNPYADYAIGFNLFTAHPQSFLLIGSYINYAIVQANQTTVIEPTGSITITDNQANHLNNRSSDPQLLKQAFELTKRFYQ